jgi:hypothetical protein
LKAKDLAIIKSFVGGGSGEGIPDSPVGRWLRTSGGWLQARDLPENTRIIWDTVVDKPVFQRLIGSTWETVTTFGSLETNKIIANKDFGGFRFRDSNGKEIHAIRKTIVSTSENNSSVTFGNYESEDGHYLATTMAGLTQIKCSDKNQSIEVRKGEEIKDIDYFELTYIPKTKDMLCESYTLDCMINLKDICYNMALYHIVDDKEILISDFNNDDENQTIWKSGYRNPNYKINFIQGINDIKLDIPVPCRIGQNFIFKIWLSQPIPLKCKDGLPNMVIKGKEIFFDKVVTARSGTIDEMHNYEINSPTIWYDKKNDNIMVYMNGRWIETNSFNKYMSLRDNQNLRVNYETSEELSLTIDQIKKGQSFKPIEDVPVTFSEDGVYSQNYYKLNYVCTNEIPFIVAMRNDLIASKVLSFDFEWYNKRGSKLPIKCNLNTIKLCDREGNELDQDGFEIKVYSDTNITIRFSLWWDEREIFVKFGEGNIFEEDELFWREVRYRDEDGEQMFFNNDGSINEFFTSNLVGKYKDLTKDFHTFFDKSGMYRCFGMMDNIPDGYNRGDNDFFVNVYDTCENYKVLDALDIRSGRKHVMNMYNGKWNPWFEPGLPLVPKRVYLEKGVRVGSKQLIELDRLVGISEKDTLIVNCGTRGMAVRVETEEELEFFPASYCISDANGEFIYFIEAQGTDNTLIEISKYMPLVPEQPKPWIPHLTLLDVEDIGVGIPQGEPVRLDMRAKSWELVRIPMLVMRGEGGEARAELKFDGKERYYFEFPFDGARLKQGEEITYFLVWDDQIGNQYTGDERVVKIVM